MAKKFVMKPWMIIVASVVVIGAIAGVVVMTLPKKKNDDSVLKSSPPPEMPAKVVEEVKKIEEENKKIEEEKAVAEQEVQKEIQKVQKTGQKVDANKIKAKYANIVKQRVQQRQQTHCRKGLYLDEDNKCRGTDSECPKFTHEYKTVNGRNCGRCVKKLSLQVL